MKVSINEAADIIAGASTGDDIVIQKGIMFVKLLGNILEVVIVPKALCCWSMIQM
jgi:hypothetical protein